MCLYAWLVISELNISSYQKNARAVWSMVKKEKLHQPKLGFLFIFQASCNICTAYADRRHKLVIKRICRCASFYPGSMHIFTCFWMGEIQNTVQHGCYWAPPLACYAHWGLTQPMRLFLLDEQRCLWEMFVEVKLQICWFSAFCRTYPPKSIE